ncbi:response regulator [Gemmatimonas groenlandica]|uniref:histidine kinase n=1 Tax=Gemmatimonas groenlandica TaxID=2732249 RepID=A0A6M4IMA1_9BACT|nr:response regulator [Gemmatimonas groenlandica]QJR35018.1 response regulator [Gemmatimonas groenlandica]
MTMTPTAVPPTSASSSLDPVSILLVDDQPGKLLTYEAMLESLGEHLLKANSGRAALDLLLKHDVTLILMDVSMPDLDGFELAGIIRDHPRYSKTAIIFVSAVHLTDIDQLKGYESGAVDYVSVPVVPELLRAKVRVFTELYRKTRESERLTRELEQRVLERTAELEAAMTRQVELTTQLRDADRKKDEFLALLAHELRNPLAPVQNAVSIMQYKQIEDAELRWCRDVIERQSHQLARLVDDLLDVSRITHGKIVLRPEEVDLSALVTSAVETCRPQIDAHHHQLHVSMPKRPVRLLGDPTRLTQVIANLLNNAAKYQLPYGVIDIVVERVGDRAQLHVRDRGVGMTPVTIESIFELFAQGERSVERSQGGLGVGLSLVRTLVELHGGTVRARSDGLGMGSEFTIELPAITTGVRVVQRGQTALADGAAPRGARVLIVDDNRDSAESMAALLTLHGHHVRVAYDGETGLEMIDQETPDVMLLDIGLPGMDGYEVCRRTRARGLADVQIIAMSGFGQDQDVRRSREVGFDAHTVKPLKIAILLDILRSRKSPAALAIPNT